MQKSKSIVGNGQAGTKAEQSVILEKLGFVASSSGGTSDDKGENQTKETSSGEAHNNSEDQFATTTEECQQKNKKKCWVCKAKLELAQRELGCCKCGKLHH